MYQRVVLKERIFKDFPSCNIMDFDIMFLCTYLFISSLQFYLKMSVFRTILYNIFFAIFSASPDNPAIQRRK